MLEVFRVASPFLLLALVIVILAVMWMVSSLERRQRIIADHVESLERDLEQVNEGLVLLTDRGTPNRHDEGKPPGA